MIIDEKRLIQRAKEHKEKIENSSEAYSQNGIYYKGRLHELMALTGINEEELK